MFTGADVEADRRRRGLSRSRYAELVGLTPTKVANIEHGRTIRPDELELLLPFVNPTLAQRFDDATSTDPTLTVLPDYVLSPGDVYLLTEDELDAFIVEVGPPSSPTPVPSPPLPASVVTATDRSDPAPAPVDVVTAPASSLPSAEAGARFVSNSELQTFKHCRRRWWLAWHRGLQLRDLPSTGPRPLGTRVHEALARYYVANGQPREDPRDALESVIRDDESKLIASLVDREAAEAATRLVEFQKEADLARAMVEGYVDWLADTGVDQGYRVIGPEQVLAAPFEVPLVDGSVVTVYLIGRLDARLYREHDGVILFMDHKTVPDFSGSVRMLVFDEQMKMYRLLEELNRGEGDPDVAGALYNMLRKVKRTQTAKPPFYERVEVRHNRTELTEFQSRLRGEIRVLLDVEASLYEGDHHQFVAYPTPSNDCLWKCDFSAICPMFDDGSRVEDFISENYVAVHPLRRYEPDLAAALQM